jgi:poly(A) polymerase
MATKIKPYQNLPPLVIPEEQPVSEDGPQPQDLDLSRSMYQYINVTSPPETSEGNELRTRCLVILETMLKSWVRRMAVEHGIPAEDADSCGGRIFVSGSFRLGVCGPGSDIDVICVVPSFCGGEPPGLFFTSFYNEVIAKEGITKVVKIPDAAVPMIGLVLYGVEIDLLISVMGSADATLDHEQLLDDQILQGIDEKSTKALNGPRVTELLYRLTEHNYEHYRLCLRCLRFWSKQRGIYSNKLGYLGGVNFAILAAKVVQWYPYGSAFTLMHNVFAMMIQWKWPTEIRLTKEYDPGIGNHKQWDPAKDRRNQQDLMPVITPAYPIMNSTYSVNKSSFNVMQSEFKRAYELCETIAEKIHQRTKSGESISNCSNEWTKLFEPVSFFARSKYYLRLDIVAQNSEDFTSWEGFALSRVRHLLLKLERLPLAEVRVFPKDFPREINEEQNEGSSSSSSSSSGGGGGGGGSSSSSSSVSGASVSEQTTEDELCGKFIFIGLTPDHSRLRGTLVLNPIIQKFQKENLSTFRDRKQGMDMKITICKWKDLPEIVFGERGREFFRAEHQIFKKEQKHLKELAEQERKDKEEEWAKQVQKYQLELNQGDSNREEVIESTGERATLQSAKDEESAAAAAAAAAAEKAMLELNDQYGVGDTLTTSTTTSNNNDDLKTTITGNDVNALQRPVQQQKMKRKKKMLQKKKKKRKVELDFFD